MPTLGDLVIDLRTARGLTQRALAERAACDPETIGRVEQGRGPSWSRRTARRIYEVLAGEMPFSEAEAREYLALTRLGESLLRPPFIASGIQREIAAEDAGLAVPTDPTSRDMRDTYRLMDASTAVEQLAEVIGAGKALAVIKALTLALGGPASTAARPTGREINVVSPPRQLYPNAVEQVHRTYEVVPEPPKAQAAPKPKARKRSG